MALNKKKLPKENTTQNLPIPSDDSVTETLNGLKNISNSSSSIPDSKFENSDVSKTANTNTDVKKGEKKLGGRPTNESKGLKTRKKYSFTFEEDFYSIILEKAHAEDRSPSKYIEHVLIDYWNNES